MKNKNNIEQYFYQKDFSILEIILIIIAVVSLIVATFVQGGGPIGLPILLVCIVVLCICRSFRIKEDEIERTLKKILDDNNVECSENAIKCYELRNTVVKKRKDGKFISPNYYITDITLSSEDTVFNVYIIDLIKQSLETVCYNVKCSEIITLTEETVKTNAGPAKMVYLKAENGLEIPVVLNDYKSSELLQKICDRHTKG